MIGYTKNNQQLTKSSYQNFITSILKSTTVSFMSELLKLRDNYLYFSGGFHLDQVDIATLIDYVATIALYRALFAYALVCFYFYSAVCTSYVLLYDNNSNNNNKWLDFTVNIALFDSEHASFY